MGQNKYPVKSPCKMSRVPFIYGGGDSNTSKNKTGSVTERLEFALTHIRRCHHTAITLEKMYSRSGVFMLLCFSILANSLEFATERDYLICASQADC